MGCDCDRIAVSFWHFVYLFYVNTGPGEHCDIRINLVQPMQIGVSAGAASDHLEQALIHVDENNQACLHSCMHAYTHV